MIRRPPRSTLDRSSAASDVYKRQGVDRPERIGDLAPYKLVVDRITRPESDVGLALGAVSYTHLRAHETVLDLVCRLLLEKKKTSHTSRSYPHTDTLDHYNTQS